MTYEQMLGKLQTIYPHQYPDSVLLMWTKELDNDIIDHIQHYFLMDDIDYRYAEDEIDTDDDLIIDEPSLYIEYLEYKISLANNEYEKANNHAANYNMYYDLWKERYSHQFASESRMPKYIKGL